MKLFFSHCCLAIVFVMASLVAYPVWAQDPSSHPDGHGLLPRNGSKNNTLSDAIRQVQRTTGGQILGAEQVQFGGRYIQRIKYMNNDGRVAVCYMGESLPACELPRSSRMDVEANGLPPRADNL
ncbi:MAG TPA: PepSY domain-containing protein [Xylella taiwanensis]